MPHSHVFILKEHKHYGTNDFLLEVRVACKVVDGNIRQLTHHIHQLNLYKENKT